MIIKTYQDTSRAILWCVVAVRAVNLVNKLSRVLKKEEKTLPEALETSSVPWTFFCDEKNDIMYTQFEYFFLSCGHFF
jgi:hypothetical protein